MEEGETKREIKERPGNEGERACEREQEWERARVGESKSECEGEGPAIPSYQRLPSSLQ